MPLESDFIARAREIEDAYNAAKDGAERVIFEYQQQKAWEIIRSHALSHVAPPPDLSSTEWAGLHVTLDAKLSWSPGRWSNDTMPWLAGFLAALDDPAFPMITVEKASRMGFTTAVNVYFGRRIHLDPCNIMYVQQTLGEGKKYSRKILAQFIIGTPCLAELFPPEKSRRMGNTLLEKEFPGGSITIVGANVPTGFRMVNQDILVLDDEDGFELVVGNEGDPVENAIGRIMDKHEGKVVQISKPTIKQVSRIHASYEQSDRRVYYVPCPECDHGQTLRWGGKDLDYGIKWAGSNDPETAYYLCESCHSVIREFHKHAMILRGEWRPTAVAFGHAGFGGLSQIYHPGIRWAKLVDRWLRVHKVPEHKQVFVNDSLGECYDDTSEGMDKDSLYNRREAYTAGHLPEGVCFIIAGIDVNGSWLEAGLYGFGRGEECWNLAQIKIDGDPLLPEVWEAMEDRLDKTWLHPSGVSLQIAVEVYDTGYLPEVVSAFVRNRQKKRRNIIAVKGDDSVKGKKLISDMPSKKSKYKVHLYIVSAIRATESIFARLKVAVAGPKHVHFPLERDEDFFEGLLAERWVPVRRDGILVRVLKRKPGVRNEPLDCLKYALAGLEWMKQHRQFDLDRLADKITALMKEKAEREAAGATEKKEEEQEEAPERTEKKRSWVKGWKR